jgi:hypothetical protein
MEDQRHQQHHVFVRDTTVPSTARMYDYWLGGHDNFAADRAAALKVPGELTVALSGNGVLSTFVQPGHFLCGYHVAILSPHDETMSVPERLWWGQCILANRFRYNYGRQANRSLSSLSLPDTVPGYIASTIIPDLVHARSSIAPGCELPPVGSWGTWKLSELFDVRKGTRVTKRNRRPGPVPFIGATTKDNGLVDYMSGPAQFPAMSISVPYNGMGGRAYAFLQPRAFCASDDVHVLVPRDIVPRAALLFVCTLIRKERYRFSFGRKWHLGRMVEDVIRLPAAQDGKADWNIMARYIAGLPFSAGTSLAEDETT